MPDRAVVDRRTYCQDLLDDLSGIEGARAAAARNRVRRCLEETEPQPRHLVALSDDRQWLVVLDPEPYTWMGDNQTYWGIYRWDSNEGQYLFDAAAETDTGQDANEVLASWLAGQEAPDAPPAVP